MAALRGRAEEAEAELAAADVSALRTRAEAAEAELDTLRARAEEGEPAVTPDLQRLRAVLQTAERERMELRAQLDTTMERLEAAEEQARALRGSSGPREAAATGASTTERTQAMPGPRTAAAGGGRFDRQAGAAPPRGARRPAERTGRRAQAEPSGPPLGERISDWVTSLTGSRSEEAQNGRADEAKPAVPPTAARSGVSRPERTRPARRTEPRAAQAAGAARSTRRTADRRRADQDHPSWILRGAAIGLLALLMVALLVIVFSLL